MKTPQQKNKVVDQVKNACYGCILNEETVIKCNDAQDAVNNFLKTASKLTSIEENSELSSGIPVHMSNSTCIELKSTKTPQTKYPTLKQSLTTKHLRWEQL